MSGREVTIVGRITHQGRSFFPKREKGIRNKRRVKVRVKINNMAKRSKVRYNTE